MKKLLFNILILIFASLFYTSSINAQIITNTPGIQQGQGGAILNGLNLNNYTLTNAGGLTSTGPTSITGTQTNGADQISRVNVNGVVNVMTYGAIGDCTPNGSTTGCTDNAAAIQAAINDAFTEGKAVFFPVGATMPTIYYSSKTLDPEGVSLYGTSGEGVRNYAGFYPLTGVRGGRRGRQGVLHDGRGD